MCSISILKDNWRLFLQGYGEVIFGIAPGSHSSFTGSRNNDLFRRETRSVVQAVTGWNRGTQM